MGKLIPRLDYKYTLKDTYHALTGLFKKNENTSQLTELFDCEHIFFLNHARTGIRIALSALNLQENAKVAVMAYNCKTVFNAVKIAGYSPIFIDVNKNFEIDYEDLKKKGAAVEAIVVTHLFGIASSVKKIRDILPNIPIIEDCSHAFLSRNNDSIVGSEGDVSVFSIGKAKFPSIGDGGFVVVNNTEFIKEITVALNALKTPGFIKEITNVVKGIVLSLLFKPFVYGNFTLTRFKKVVRKNDLGAIYSHHEEKILNTNLQLFFKKLETIATSLEKRKKFAKHNHEVVINEKKLQTINYNFDNYNCFMIPLLAEENRDAIVEYFYDKGIELGKHFSDSLVFAKDYGYIENSCENAERLSRNIITVPTHYKIKSKNVI